MNYRPEKWKFQCQLQVYQTFADNGEEKSTLAVFSEYYGSLSEVILCRSHVFSLSLIIRMCGRYRFSLLMYVDQTTTCRLGPWTASSGERVVSELGAPKPGPGGDPPLQCSRLDPPRRHQTGTSEAEGDAHGWVGDASYWGKMTTREGVRVIWSVKIWVNELVQGQTSMILLDFIHYLLHFLF